MNSGNRNYEDSYKLTNDGVGVDLRKEYDWDQILDNSNYLKEQRKPPFEINKIWDDVGKAWDGFSILPDEGGFTFAFGGTVGGEAGISGAAAAGEFWAVDFGTRTVSTNYYWSGQAGATIGIPGLDAGIELTVFDSPDFEGAVSGMFNATGGEVAFGPAVTWEAINTLPSPGGNQLTGMQVTLGVGTPQIEVHSQFGYGDFDRDTTRRIPFSDVPNYLWNRFWGIR